MAQERQIFLSDTRLLELLVTFLPKEIKQLGDEVSNKCPIPASFVSAWASLSEEEKHEVLDCQEEIICRERPLYWLQHCTETENPKHEQQGLPYKAPFPQKSYFVPLFDAFQKYSRLFIPKTREMLTSWAVMGWGTHQAQWRAWDVLVQTDAEKKAAELVKYAWILYRNQKPHLRAFHPVASEEGTYEIRWRNGGRVMAIPHGAGKIRLYHPTLLVLDEAAFLAEAEQSFNAAAPVCSQIIAISSAGPGWFGEVCQS